MRRAISAQAASRPERTISVTSSRRMIMPGGTQRPDCRVASQALRQAGPRLERDGGAAQELLGGGVDRDDRPDPVDRHDAHRGAPQDLLDVILSASQVL